MNSLDRLESSLNDVLINDILKIVHELSEITDDDFKYSLILKLLPKMTVVALDMSAWNERSLK